VGDGEGCDWAGWAKRRDKRVEGRGVNILAVFENSVSRIVWSC
jgi:hypothetical protein